MSQWTPSIIFTRKPRRIGRLLNQNIVGGCRVAVVTNDVIAVLIAHCEIKYCDRWRAIRYSWPIIFDMVTQTNQLNKQTIKQYVISVDWYIFHFISFIRFQHNKRRK